MVYKDEQLKVERILRSIMAKLQPFSAIVNHLPELLSQPVPEHVQ
jgi:hypothetical protein